MTDSAVIASKRENMKAPSFISNLSVVTVPQLINSLNDNSNFEDYLSSIKFCLENNINIDPLKQWWDNNNQKLAYSDVLLDFASLLEDLQITNHPSNGSSVAGTQSAQKPKRKKRLNYKYLPWTNTLFVLPTLVGHKAYIGTSEFLGDYNKCLKQFAPPQSAQTHKPNKKTIIAINTAEHDHIKDISEWVSQKSPIKDSIYILQGILKTRPDKVSNSGKVFKSACSCPHKLFRLFMESDFTGYDLTDGEALLHILSLPMAVAPNENYPAYLTPDYPFFDNDIFPDNFNVLSKSTLDSLAVAWKVFYLKYDQLCGTQNHNRTFVGGEKLFNLTLNSLANDNNSTSMTAPILTKIMRDTEPNIWIVQYWLHFVVLDPNSRWLSVVKLENFDYKFVMAGCVDYFFSVADYIYHKGVSEISSRVLVAGITQVIFWARNHCDLALTVFKNFFPVIFNHRRTEPFNQFTDYMRKYLEILEKNSQNTPKDLLAYRGNIMVILDYNPITRIQYSRNNSLSNIKLVAEATNSIQPNNPCFIDYNLNTLQISEDHDYKSIATILVNIIAACLNTNGGDVFITIPLNNKKTPIGPSELFSKAISSIRSIRYIHEYTNFHSWEENDEQEVNWIKCYRCSRPAFTNIDNELKLPITTSSCEYPTLLNRVDADNYISEHFPLHDQVQPIVLTI